MDPKAKRTRKFMELVEAAGPLPVCEVCGRCVMVGGCCEKPKSVGAATKVDPERGRA